jgi:hypothetical protein
MTGKHHLFHLFVVMGAGPVAASLAADGPSPAPNGVTFPADYKNWRVLSTSHRTDKNSLRVILGNDIAMQAARSGPQAAWPDGTILAKVAWKEAVHEKWPAAIVPGELTHVEFMVKDSRKFTATGGWGYGRWLGRELSPYGADAGFAKECFDCHTAVKDTDYVFTRPPALP